MSRSGIRLMCLCIVLGGIGLSWTLAGPAPDDRRRLGMEPDCGTGADWSVCQEFSAYAEMEAVSLAQMRISTRELRNLIECRRLAYINLEGCPIDDDGCEVLARLGALTDLCLVGTRVTDRGVQALCESPRLESLDLRGTGVTEEVVVFLAGCDRLRFVDLRGTRVSADGAAQLRIAVPEIRVLCDCR